MNSAGDAGVSSTYHMQAVHIIVLMRSVSPSHAGVVYDGAVTRADVDVWASGLDDVLARIRQLFYRDGVAEACRAIFSGAAVAD